MDLKHYFRRIRETEEALKEEYPLVVSNETGDGGKAGQVCQVSKARAAKLIVEGKATLANEAERDAYLEQQATARKAAARAEFARRVQVAIVADPDAESTPQSKKK